MLDKAIKIVSDAWDYIWDLFWSLSTGKQIEVYIALCVLSFVIVYAVCRAVAKHDGEFDRKGEEACFAIAIMFALLMPIMWLCVFFAIPFATIALLCWFVKKTLFPNKEDD